MKRKRVGSFIEVAAWALILYALLSIFGAWRQLRLADARLAALEAELAKADAECLHLESLISHGGEDAYVIHAARETLGLSMPGEITFIDISR